MIENGREFADLLMEEIGLEVDEDGIIIDQDTQEPVRIKNDKFLKYREEKEKIDGFDCFSLSKNQVAFDPLNVPNLSHELMKYYAAKVEAEKDVYLQTYYSSPAPTDPEKGVIDAVFNNGTGICSGAYYSDNLKYADIILGMNESTQDFTALDKKPVIDKKQTKTGRKGGRKR